MKDPGCVQIIERTCFHDIIKDPSEMGLAQMAHICKIFYSEAGHIVLSDIFKGRRNDDGIFMGFGGFELFIVERRINPYQLHEQRKKQPFYAELIIHILFF